MTLHHLSLHHYDITSFIVSVIILYNYDSDVVNGYKLAIAVNGNSTVARCMCFSAVSKYWSCSTDHFLNIVECISLFCQCKPLSRYITGCKGLYRIQLYLALLVLLIDY